jgi:hypothetical protein
MKHVLSLVPKLGWILVGFVFFYFFYFFFNSWFFVLTNIHSFKNCLDLFLKEALLVGLGLVFLKKAWFCLFVLARNSIHLQSNGHNATCKKK